MNVAVKAVIFDMDGVLVDSEPLWRKAMIKGFAEVNMPITEDECRKTQGTRFKEVVQMWLKHYQRKDLKAAELENNILLLLVELIRQEGKCMEGITELLEFCINKGLLIGLATSSSHLLMNTVLDHLHLRHYFKATVSAEFMPYGKPHPEVFLKCAEALACIPQECLVIEDSVNGLIAAKSAQMLTVAVPDPDHKNLRQFALADYRADNSAELAALFKNLFL